MGGREKWGGDIDVGLKITGSKGQFTTGAAASCAAISVTAGATACAVWAVTFAIVPDHPDRRGIAQISTTTRASEGDVDHDLVRSFGLRQMLARRPRLFARFAGSPLTGHSGLLG
jgi:hypothetical protein